VTKEAGSVNAPPLRSQRSCAQDVNLLIEITFIATFTQRFFAR
jgi:hypothetical protein